MTTTKLAMAARRYRQARDAQAQRREEMYALIREESAKPDGLSYREIAEEVDLTFARVGQIVQEGR